MKKVLWLFNARKTLDFFLNKALLCFFIILDKEEFQEEKPGIRFTERMVGDLTFQSDFKKARCDFILTIESEDVEEMIEKDPKHRASIAGTVTCKRLSDEPMTVSSGDDLVLFILLHSL